MGQFFFCNIGWMSRYEGLKGKPDKIVGGGKYIDENATGGEVCNFLITDNGYVYGHVETIKDKLDRKIRIESFGGSGDSASGVDVIWTATDPDEGGRRVVGWYLDATVFRERQNFTHAPSKQHNKDQISNYRICALAKNVRRLDIDDRRLAMGRGTGWMGHTPWWTPPQKPSDEISKFLQEVRKLINDLPIKKAGKPKKSESDPKSPSAAADPYVRYVQNYEVKIAPRHCILQERFEKYLKPCGVSELKSNLARVDLRYRNSGKALFLVEIKPCDRENARYAIRTAIGQLLDYRQTTSEKSGMLIVLEVKPKKVDKELAISNGFGIAYPSNGTFKVIWP